MTVIPSNICALLRALLILLQINKCQGIAVARKSIISQKVDIVVA